VTALGKLVRSTAFRLTLVYLLIFVLYAAALLAYFALNTGRLITEQITATVETEIAVLTEQYTVGGLRRLVLILENRSLEPRTAALCALVGATGMDRKVFADLDPKMVKRRLTEISEGSWAAAAVKATIDQVQAAVMVAVMAATTATTITST